jgi:hypothetical protein
MAGFALSELIRGESKAIYNSLAISPFCFIAIGTNKSAGSFT